MYARTASHTHCHMGLCVAAYVTCIAGQYYTIDVVRLGYGLLVSVMMHLTHPSHGSPELAVHAIA